MDQWQLLLERFLRNECTDSENKIVFHALREGLIDDELRHVIELAMNDQEMAAYIDCMEPVSDNLLKNIRLRINQSEEEPVNRRLVIPEWLKIAAAVAITLTMSWMVFHRKAPDNPMPETAITTIRVPAGQTVNLTLSDGSNVWLNARSTLKYPGIFTGNRRELFLEGEGFFDVSENPEKPFVVHAAGYEIQALGTQFNVEAYESRYGFSASLLKGSIQISDTTNTYESIVLQPNTMARRQEGQLIAEDITDFDHYRWREGIICFDKMPFHVLMTTFEKCYGIKIVVENKNLNHYAPTGKFRKSDGIDYALRVLQRNFRFRFERDEEKHIIYIK
ncbi:MAG: FecR family protein [Tannerella sp.]|jgi:ferric-dicitrate binding protein FerR (iron transport regulator)|nr:FecR family protein [Tannerella sp.]